MQGTLPAQSATSRLEGGISLPTNKRLEPWEKVQAACVKGHLYAGKPSYVKDLTRARCGVDFPDTDVNFPAEWKDIHCIPCVEKHCQAYPGDTPKGGARLAELKKAINLP
jgi:hypothetical protein